MNKKLLLYPLIIGFFGCLTWFIIDQGSHLVTDGSTPASSVVEAATAASAASAHSTAESVWLGMVQNVHHPLALLLLQIILILLTARLFGWLANKIGQPAVVGEIVAGICLGPSLLGMALPSVSAFVFPAEGFKNLQFLSQIGLAFFMFVVGMELDTHKMKNKAHDAVMISHASIVFPFFLGVLLAYYIYGQFAPANVSFLSFSLFMGIAMSITAFPVLARIVQERKLSSTPLGLLAITCAAADDVTAWCILAVVIAIVKAGTLWTAALTLALSLVFLAIMLYVLKPWLAKKIAQFQRQQKEKSIVALAFMVLLFSAWAAEVIGIHALFGAFLAGVIMPAEVSVQKLLTDKLEDVSVLLLLPIFFVFTGLRTQIGLLGQGQLWSVFGLIMLVAVGGKLGGSALTAKLMGQSWMDALGIGALMNTRGLMELVVLNIGYDLGILSPEIFAMLVLMALATTFMTGPLLDIVKKVEENRLQASQVG
ncbi:cation:proton antiporter [Chitinophaga rhizophila]|uniref:Cation:proton antiporter n=1 Tax=Chitinophaga rhizophila TaxID=2866212 RepID=A0ABS7GG45_9BACT|nr:cation:proton antiporter [Chitinophaga rhizophila]MBW8686665.1 cation:proton antiporter [Chitinophaga rhizophila]